MHQAFFSLRIVLIIISFVYRLVSTLKRRPSPSTSSLSSNSSSDRRGGAIQLTKFGKFGFSSRSKKFCLSSLLDYLDSFSGKNNVTAVVSLMF